MSATLGMKQVRIKITGVKTEVPDNAIAKLMYYLDCVATVIQYDDRTLTDYQNFDELTGQQLLAVYQLAKLLNPSLFIRAGIFIIDESLLIDTSNQFYEIEDETIGVHVNHEIMIGGRSIKVLKLMACNQGWLTRNYYGPIERIDTLVRKVIEERNNNISDEDSDFGGVPVKKFCHYCNKTITTKVEEKCSYLACICCLLFNVIFCCVQICAQRSLICCNFTHKCPRCGRVLGTYNAC